MAVGEPLCLMVAPHPNPLVKKPLRVPRGERESGKTEDIVEGMIGLRSSVRMKVRRAAGPGILWKISNLRNLWRGWWRHQAARLLGVGHFYGTLEARLRRADGSVVNYGLISTRVITDAGVAFLVDDWDDDTTDITDMKFHASGEGTDAEAAGDTALGSEATTVTDRAEGTPTQPAANQLRSTATQNYTGAAAITEHGIFSVVTESTGVLWDRSMFSAVNVANGDSITWTYTCTVSAGG